MVRLDISNRKVADGFWMLFIELVCLEYVPDDRRAMKECFRLFKKSGWASVFDFITTDRTFEDAGIVEHWRAREGVWSSELRQSVWKI